MIRKSAWLAALALTTSLAGFPAAAPAFAGELVGGHDPQAGETEAADEAKQAAAMGEVFTLAEIWIEGQREYHNIPAISAAVVKGNDTIWAKGFGHTDRTRTMPATADTIYSICSISKLFTSVALMQQWEQGTVRLDEPVTTYLPWANFAADAEGKRPASVPVTLRGLLTHSAGLPRESKHPYWTGPDFSFPTQSEIRDRIGQQQVLYPASREFQYSNLGLTLVGETVEAVSGTPYADYVTANIIEPLGLEDTRPMLPVDLYGGQMAVGWGSQLRDASRPEVALFDARGIAPAAGYSSTVNDLAKFAQWQFRLLRDETPEILEATTLREMQRVHYVSPDWDTHWGLGFAVWQLDGRTIASHGGACPGYRSTLMIDPAEETAITVMMNSMDNPGEFARGLGGLMGKRMSASDMAEDVADVPDLAEFAGYYDAQPWGNEFVIVPWSGGLAVLDLPSGDPAGDMGLLKPLGGDRFIALNDKGRERDVVEFERDADGRVTRIIRFDNNNTRVRSLD